MSGTALAWAEASVLGTASALAEVSALGTASAEVLALDTVSVVAVVSVDNFPCLRIHSYSKPVAVAGKAVAVADDMAVAVDTAAEPDDSWYCFGLTETRARWRSLTEPTGILVRRVHLETAVPRSAKS